MVYSVCGYRRHLRCHGIFWYIVRGKAEYWSYDYVFSQHNCTGSDGNDSVLDVSYQPAGVRVDSDGSLWGIVCIIRFRKFYIDCILYFPRRSTSFALGNM
jgi:hypothetical protein